LDNLYPAYNSTLPLREVINRKALCGGAVQQSIA